MWATVVVLQRRSLPGLVGRRIDLAWCVMILASAAALWTHNTAVLLVLAVNGVVLGVGLVSWWAGRVQRGRGLLARTTEGEPVARTTEGVQRTHAASFLKNWLLAQAGVLLLWSPWLPGFVAQSQAVFFARAFTQGDYLAHKLVAGNNRCLAIAGSVRVAPKHRRTQVAL